MKKYIPNILSVLRIICSVLLILFINDRIGFVFLYFVIGLTDILDGFIARKFKLESEFGARLDSFADFIFYIMLVFIFTKLYSSIILVNYKVALVGIVFIRLLNLLLTKLKYKKFVFVHTIVNKISGVLLYFLPVIILFKQSDIIIWITLAFVFIAAIEELLITIKYSEVKLNRKSIFYE
ncbi:CDP-alcohol phosphatidyltransferase family protein [Brassicibacter mesophilus]|uniref:CDP-alcohol phosphatidyltransferase family protein n=1 Tax=Brassicibacter mesophilus TaxID=745119 RepID=UPI003D1B9C4B